MLFLYPDDSDDKGCILRVYQEYFMVANAAQLLVQEAEQRGSNLYDLAEYAAVQINDTHPLYFPLLTNERQVDNKGPRSRYIMSSPAARPLELPCHAKAAHTRHRPASAGHA